MHDDPTHQRHPRSARHPRRSQGCNADVRGRMQAGGAFVSARADRSRDSIEDGQWLAASARVHLDRDSASLSLEESGCAEMIAKGGAGMTSGTPPMEGLGERPPCEDRVRYGGDPHRRARRVGGGRSCRPASRERASIFMKTKDLPGGRTASSSSASSLEGSLCTVSESPVSRGCSSPRAWFTPRWWVNGSTRRSSR